MRVEGGAALAEALRFLAKVAEKQVLRSALRLGAARIRNLAEVKTPRNEGAPDIADHIVVSNGRTTEPHEVVMLVGPSKERREDPRQPGRRITFARQGVWLEYGTSDTAAQPFMRPAFDEGGDGAVQEVRDALWREVMAGRASPSGGGLL